MIIALVRYPDPSDQCRNGYTSAPTITLTPSPTGDTATAYATIGGVGEYGSNNTGQISSVVVTHAGSGYVNAPTVNFGTDGGGTGGAAQAFLTGMPRGDLTMDIININLYWGNTRIPMRYLPWTQFNAELRYWQNYVGRPIAYSMYGPNGFYISPAPDQNYAMEIDTVVMPSILYRLTILSWIFLSLGKILFRFTRLMLPNLRNNLTARLNCSNNSTKLKCRTSSIRRTLDVCLILIRGRTNGKIT